MLRGCFLEEVTLKLSLLYRPASQKRILQQVTGQEQKHGEGGRAQLSIARGAVLHYRRRCKQGPIAAVWDNWLRSEAVWVPLEEPKAAGNGLLTIRLCTFPEPVYLLSAWPCGVKV